MVVAILSRCHLLVGSFTCLVASSVMVAFGLAALGEGNMRFAETLECRNVGFASRGVVMVLLGVRHSVRDPESQKDDC